MSPETSAVATAGDEDTALYVSTSPSGSENARTTSTTNAPALRVSVRSSNVPTACGRPVADRATADRRQERAVERPGLRRRPDSAPRIRMKYAAGQRLASLGIVGGLGIVSVTAPPRRMRSALS